MLIQSFSIKNNYQQRLEDFTTKRLLQTYSNPGWKGPVGELCKVAPISFFWTPNGLNQLPEMPFGFPFNMIGRWYFYQANHGS